MLVSSINITIAIYNKQQQISANMNYKNSTGPRSSFSIDTYSGDVRIAKVIDRDAYNFDPYFDLVITASCKNYPDFSRNSSSTVLINDTNDNPPRFDKPVYNFYEVDVGYVGRLSQIEILISDPDLVIISNI